MLAKTVGEDAPQGRGDAHGAELATAVERTGTTGAMGVMEAWALLGRGMYVWLSQAPVSRMLAEKGKNAENQQCVN